MFELIAFNCVVNYVRGNSMRPGASASLLASRLDSLIQRLQHTRIHRCNHVDSRIELFFGHSRFPCVRKAALHSRIA
jgi:hypothetical protein